MTCILWLLLAEVLRLRFCLALSNPQSGKSDGPVRASFCGEEVQSPTSTLRIITYLLSLCVVLSRALLNFPARLALYRPYESGSAFMFCFFCSRSPPSRQHSSTCASSTSDLPSSRYRRAGSTYVVRSRPSSTAWYSGTSPTRRIDRNRLVQRRPRRRFRYVPFSGTASCFEGLFELQIWSWSIRLVVPVRAFYTICMFAQN